MNIRELYLIVLVHIIHQLIKWKILKNVWYTSELDLADIRAKKLFKLLNLED